MSATKDGEYMLHTYCPRGKVQAPLVHPGKSVEKSLQGGVFKPCNEIEDKTFYCCDNKTNVVSKQLMLLCQTAKERSSRTDVALALLSNMIGKLLAPEVNEDERMMRAITSDFVDDCIESLKSSHPTDYLSFKASLDNGDQSYPNAHVEDHFIDGCRLDTPFWDQVIGSIQMRLFLSSSINTLDGASAYILNTAPGTGKTLAVAMAIAMTIYKEVPGLEMKEGKDDYVYVAVVSDFTTGKRLRATEPEKGEADISEVRRIAPRFGVDNPDRPKKDDLKRDLWVGKGKKNSKIIHPKWIQDLESNRHVFRHVLQRIEEVQQAAKEKGKEGQTRTFAVFIDEIHYYLGDNNILTDALTDFVQNVEMPPHYRLRIVGLSGTMTQAHYKTLATLLTRTTVSEPMRAPEVEPTKIFAMVRNIPLRSYYPDINHLSENGNLCVNDPASITDDPETWFKNRQDVENMLLHIRQMVDNSAPVCIVCENTNVMTMVEEAMVLNFNPGGKGQPDNPFDHFHGKDILMVNQMLVPLKFDNGSLPDDAALTTLSEQRRHMIDNNTLNEKTVEQTEPIWSYTIKDTGDDTDKFIKWLDEQDGPLEQRKRTVVIYCNTATGLNIGGNRMHQVFVGQASVQSVARTRRPFFPEMNVDGPTHMTCIAWPWLNDGQVEEVEKVHFGYAVLKLFTGESEQAKKRRKQTRFYVCNKNFDTKVPLVMDGSNQRSMIAEDCDVSFLDLDQLSVLASTEPADAAKSITVRDEQDDRLFREGYMSTKHSQKQMCDDFTDTKRGIIGRTLCGWTMQQCQDREAVLKELFQACCGDKWHIKDITFKEINLQPLRCKVYIEVETNTQEIGAAKGSKEASKKANKAAKEAAKGAAKGAKKMGVRKVITKGKEKSTIIMPEKKPPTKESSSLHNLGDDITYETFWDQRDQRKDQYEYELPYIYVKRPYENEHRILKVNTKMEHLVRILARYSSCHRLLALIETLTQNGDDAEIWKQVNATLDDHEDEFAVNVDEARTALSQQRYTVHIQSGKATVQAWMEKFKKIDTKQLLKERFATYDDVRYMERPQFKFPNLQTAIERELAGFDMNDIHTMERISFVESIQEPNDSTWQLLRIFSDSYGAVEVTDAILKLIEEEKVTLSGPLLRSLSQVNEWRPSYFSSRTVTFDIDYMMLQAEEIRKNAERKAAEETIVRETEILKGLEGDIGDLFEEANQLQAEHEQKIAEQEQKIAEHKKKIAEHEEKIAELAAEHETKKQHLETKHSELESEVNAVKNTIKEAEQRRK